MLNSLEHILSDWAGLLTPGSGRSTALDAASADSLVVPSAHLLFQGSYHRDGFDLVVTDERDHLVIHDYFRPGHRPELKSPEGAALTADVIKSLTLSDQGERYAQAGGAPAPQPIGRVEAVSGGATAIRNGVVVVLNVGDLVYKGDTVQTDRGASLSLVFIDGTTFSLSSSARMVLSEMLYQPGASPIVQQAPAAPNEPPAQTDPNGQPASRTGGSGTSTAVAADASARPPSQADAASGANRVVVLIDEPAALAARGLGVAPANGGQSSTIAATISTPSSGRRAPEDGTEQSPTTASTSPIPLVNYLAASDGTFMKSPDDGVLGRVIDAETGQHAVPTGEHVVSVRSPSGDGEAHVVAASGSTTVLGRYGVLVISADGAYTYLPSTDAAMALPDAVHGEDNFEINMGSVAPSGLTFGVVGIDDVPTVHNNVHGQVVVAGTSAVASGRAAGVLFDDIDPDTGETTALRVQSIRTLGAAAPTALSPDGGATGTSATIVGAYGTLTIHGDGTYSYAADHAARLGAGAEATDRFIYTAGPDGRLQAAAYLDFQVAGVADAPVANDIAVETEGDSAVTIDVDGLVLDPDGDALTLTAEQTITALDTTVHVTGATGSNEAVTNSLTASGAAGSDQLTGGNAASGTQVTNYLDVGSGSDHLTAGGAAGSGTIHNVLTGGVGGDTFTFRSGSAANTITDFLAESSLDGLGDDLIEQTVNGVTDSNAVIAATSDSNETSTVHLGTDGPNLANELFLQNIAKNALVAADFHLA